MYTTYIKIFTYYVNIEYNILIIILINIINYYSNINNIITVRQYVPCPSF